MIRDLEARFSGYPFVKLSIHWLGHIKNTAALLTPEVMVVPSISLEAALVVGKVQLQDLTLLFQRFQVAVNSSQADIGYFLSHLLINPISGGVGSRSL